MTDEKALEMQVDRFFLEWKLRRCGKVVDDRGFKRELLLRGGQNELGGAACAERECDESCTHDLDDGASGEPHHGCCGSHGRRVSECGGARKFGGPDGTRGCSKFTRARRYSLDLDLFAGGSFDVRSQRLSCSRSAKSCIDCIACWKPIGSWPEKS